MLKNKFEEAKAYDKYGNIIAARIRIDPRVLLTALRSDDQNIYFQKLAKGNISEQLLSAQSLKSGISSTNFCGCDTTSIIFQQGKLEFLTVFEKNKHQTEAIKIFENPAANPGNVANTGNRFLLSSTKLSIRTLFVFIIQKSLKYCRFATYRCSSARRDTIRTCYQLWYRV